MKARPPSASPTRLINSMGVSLSSLIVELGLARVSKQMRRRERSQMRIGVEHPTD